jgi:ELWxxDGT repeat protein
VSFKTVFLTAGGLWVTDGTAAGTVKLETLPEDASPSPIVLGNEVLFNEPVGFSFGIGVTDGTTAGTSLISPPASEPIGGGYEMIYPANIGGKVIGEVNLFSGLLVTNGTTAGTSVLSFPTVPAPLTWSITTPLVSLGTKVVFGAGNTHPTFNGLVSDLWISDGTSAGTHPLVVAGEANSGLNLFDITGFGNKAAFLGEDSSNQEGFWVTDGTAAGTSEIITPTLPDGSFPTDLLAFGSKLLFRAQGTDAKSSLWITDGTDAGTQEIVVPLTSSTPFSNPSLFPTPLVAFGSKALFLGSDGVQYGLWVTDGTSGGTQELSTPGLQVDGSAPGTGTSINPTDFFVYGNKVLFRGTDTVGKIGLWITDGTSAGTVEITPSNAFFPGLEPSDFSLAGTNVVFQATNAAGNTGLWTTDGTAAGTVELTANTANTTSSASLLPLNLTTFNTDLLTSTQITLKGSSGQYVVVNDGGSLYLQDTVAGRDGVQILPGVNEIVFTNGVGIFDPSGAAENVARLYGAALRRGPDAAGLEGWGAQINSGVPLAAVANSFTTSPEFIQDYGSLSDPAFVSLLYQNVLNRAADPAGAQSWDNALASGANRGSVLAGFAESQEYEANTISTAGDPNNGEIYRLYEAALGRAPDIGGQGAWSSALASGATPTQVAQQLVTSAEFLKDYGNLSPSDFVSTLYQNVLHRAADPAGLQSWTNALQQGASEASVVVGFADSLENLSRTAGPTHANWVFIPT